MLYVKFRLFGLSVCFDLFVISCRPMFQHFSRHSVKDDILDAPPKLIHFISLQESPTYHVINLLDVSSELLLPEGLSFYEHKHRLFY